MSTKISQLTSATDITANDLIQIVDVEDGVMAPSGTNKKATASLLANQLVPLVNAGAINGSKISDSSIAPAKLSTGGPSWDSSGLLSIKQISVNNPSGDSSMEIGGSNNVYIDLKKPNSDDFDMRIAVDSGNAAIETQVPFYINPSSNQMISMAAGGGNVGIGTSTPDARLNVEDDSANDAVRITQTGSGNALVVEDSTNPDATPFVVANTGNVGIGTNSPTAKLDVIGSDTIASQTNVAAKVGSGIDSDLLLGSTNGNTPFIASQGAFPLALATNATERMRITSAGNVGIGTSSPVVKLDVANSASSDVRVYETIANVDARISAVGGGGQAGIIGTYSNHPLVVYANSAERMRVTSTGVGIGTISPSYQLELSTDSAAKPSTSTWTISSDERLKENIEAADLDICYNAVKNIPLKRYKWKDEIYSAEQVADRSKIGWIAQDVQAVFPKAVNEHKFVYNQVKDEDGNVVSEDSIDDCLSLNSDQIYAALFGAVQKLMGEVESLQGRIAELEATP